MARARSVVGTENVEQRRRWREFWRGFGRNKLAVVGLVLVFTMFFTGIFATAIGQRSQA